MFKNPYVLESTISFRRSRTATPGEVDSQNTVQAAQGLSSIAFLFQRGILKYLSFLVLPTETVCLRCQEKIAGTLVASCSLPQPFFCSAIVDTYMGFIWCVRDNRDRLKLAN